MKNWQPIETAPRDGTAVMVYANRSQPYAGSPFMGVREWRGSWWGEPNISARDLDDWLDSDQYLTHWKPLPGGPK